MGSPGESGSATPTFLIRTWLPSDQTSSSESESIPSRSRTSVGIVTWPFSLIR
jgi:hypothetical protein